MILRKAPILFLGLAFSSAVQAEIYSCVSTVGERISELSRYDIPNRMEGTVFIVDTSKGIKTAEARDENPDEYFGHCQSYEASYGDAINHFCHTQNEFNKTNPVSIFVQTGMKGIEFSASVLGVVPELYFGKCVKI